MAYINPTVYASGINSTILDGGQNIVLVLANEELSGVLGNSPATVLATTKSFTGSIKIGSLVSNVLTINSRDYSETYNTAIVTDTSPKQATHFAILKVSNAVVINGSTSTAIANSAFSGATVYASGKLTANVYINNNSQFKFNGASITFATSDAS